MLLRQYWVISWRLNARPGLIRFSGHQQHSSRRRNQSRRRLPQVLVVHVSLYTAMSAEEAPAKKKQRVVAPRGKNISGKFWKPVQKKGYPFLCPLTIPYWTVVVARFTKRLPKSWAKKQELRQRHKEMKALENDMKAEQRAQLEVTSQSSFGGLLYILFCFQQEEKQERIAKRKRKEENELKSTSYQVVRLCFRVVAFALLNTALDHQDGQAQENV